MSYMKTLDIRIRTGGDDAIAAACEMANLVDERRSYEETMKATGDISDIVTVLRGLGFATISPQAGDSASLLHYCVTHAADEIERLRMTNDERMAIAYSVASLQSAGNYEISAKDTLRKLLERTACVLDIDKQ